MIMFKNCVSYVFIALLLIVSLETSVEAKTYKKKKSRTSYSYSKNTKKGSSKKSKRAGKKTSSSFRRSGTGPDLRQLTTEKSDTEYTEVPDNGVNSVETKTGL
jgi:hypothetical protein